MSDNKQEDVVIEIKDLVKKYKMYNRKQDRLIETVIPKIQRHTDFTALNNIDLSIKRGEMVGILGKNGAGKSTLLKIITGVVVPTSGEVKISGKISSLLELGTAFNMELTGEENIYQNGQVMGLTMEEIEKTKQDVIDFADIGKHLYQPVKTYSSGMFSRLAFACAINVDPDILIVDEVLSVGDMAFQLKCFKKFEEFKAKGKTILFVTHNVNDIIKNCNRALILKEGSKIFDGDVKTGVDKYKKIIVGIEDKEENKDDKENKDNEDKNIEHNNKETAEKMWKETFSKNDEQLSYGDGSAEIIDYGIFDLKGDIKTSINNEEEYIVKMKVKINKEINDPIFAMTVKNFNGLDMAGANTIAYDIMTGKYKEGDEVTIEFRQVFPIAPEKYTLSFGCTTFDANGNLKVYDRKYDALIFEITSSKMSLGVVDLKSKINIERN